jgi:Predicted transcriptional regulator
MKYIIGLLRVLVAAILFILLAANGFMLISANVFRDEFPNLLDYSLLEIKENSMAPAIEEGSAVVLHSETAYDMDDIVVFKFEGDLRIRRLVGVCGDALITRGDGNQTEDDELLYTESIIGKVILQLPMAGKALMFFGTYICTAVLAVLFILLVPLPMIFGRD